MKKSMKNAGILFLLFIIGVVVYFISARNAMEKEATVYSSMEEPGLPLVYINAQGRDINCLHGYVQDMGNRAARDSITVLPADRVLPIRIAEYGNTITAISYEIRNLSMDRLVERTELTTWNSSNGSSSAELPIQNLLKKNQPYLLAITVNTGETSASYYTRILWTDNTNAADMLNLAEEFTRKSLDSEQAKDLVSYLETSATEDNSSLGHVTIKSSFNHLTWDKLPVQLEGEPQITMQEFDGIMGQVQVKYNVRISNGDDKGILVRAEDNFTMKWNQQRIYLMNYERYADEVFTGDPGSFSGKKILLGITDTRNVGTVKSPESSYLAFKTNGNLWGMNQDSKDKEAVCIFSFESQLDDGARSAYNNHDIKILTVGDDGSVDFLVYGYMNRGIYEGKTGVIYYHYDRAQNIVQEKFFVPVAESFEGLKQDVNRLSYLAPNNMIYLLLNGSVYGIDLKSNESILVAQGLTDGGFAVSTDGSRIAWQEGNRLYESEKIHVMDFTTAEKQEITGNQGDYTRVLGFVGSDLIYGFGKAEDAWIINGREKELPLYAMYIVDNQMTVESSYEKDGVYISDVTAEDGRIHLKRLVKLAANEYMYQDEDTIVCNQKIDIDPLEEIGWFASSEKGRVYYVKSSSEIKASAVNVSIPKAFSYENTSMLSLSDKKSSQSNSAPVFYAYGGGHLLGTSGSFQAAVELAYNKMGIVTDENERILWNRINRQTVRSLKDPMAHVEKMTKYLDSFTDSALYDSGFMMLDASGCSLSQVLYFVDKGMPVIAYTEGGKYLVISGYDQYNVNLYNPETQDSMKMGLGDAAAYFEGLHNGFLCGIVLE